MNAKISQINLQSLLKIFYFASFPPIASKLYFNLHNNRIEADLGSSLSFPFNNQQFIDFFVSNKVKVEEYYKHNDLIYSTYLSNLNSILDLKTNQINKNYNILIDFLVTNNLQFISSLSPSGSDQLSFFPFDLEYFNNIYQLILTNSLSESIKNVNKKKKKTPFSSFTSPLSPINYSNLGPIINENFFKEESGFVFKDFLLFNQQYFFPSIFGIIGQGNYLRKTTYSSQPPSGSSSTNPFLNSTQQSNLNTSINFLLFPLNLENYVYHQLRPLEFTLGYTARVISYLNYRKEAFLKAIEQETKSLKMLMKNRLAQIDVTVNQLLSFSSIPILYYISSLYKRKESSFISSFYFQNPQDNALKRINIPSIILRRFSLFIFPLLFFVNHNIIVLNNNKSNEYIEKNIKNNQILDFFYSLVNPFDYFYNKLTNKLFNNSNFNQSLNEFFLSFFSSSSLLSLPYKINSEIFFNKLNCFLNAKEKFYMHEYFKQERFLDELFLNLLSFNITYNLFFNKSAGASTPYGLTSMNNLIIMNKKKNIFFLLYLFSSFLTNFICRNKLEDPYLLLNPTLELKDRLNLMLSDSVYSTFLFALTKSSILTSTCLYLKSILVDFFDLVTNPASFYTSSTKWKLFSLNSDFFKQIHKISQLNNKENALHFYNATAGSSSNPNIDPTISPNLINLSLPYKKYRERNRLQSVHNEKLSNKKVGNNIKSFTNVGYDTMGIPLLPVRRLSRVILDNFSLGENPKYRSTVLDKTELKDVVNFLIKYIDDHIITKEFIAKNYSEKDKKKFFLFKKRNFLANFLKSDKNSLSFKDKFDEDFILYKENLIEGNLTQEDLEDFIISFLLCYGGVPLYNNFNFSHCEKHLISLQSLSLQEFSSLYYSFYEEAVRKLLIKFKDIESELFTSTFSPYKNLFNQRKEVSYNKIYQDELFLKSVTSSKLFSYYSNLCSLFNQLYITELESVIIANHFPPLLFNKYYSTYKDHLPLKQTHKRVQNNLMRIVMPQSPKLLYLLKNDLQLTNQNEFKKLIYQGIEKIVDRK